MGKASIWLVLFLVSSLYGLNEDMIETGYIQDPNMVGKLPMEFQDDFLRTYLIDDDDEDILEQNHDDIEEWSFENDVDDFDPEIKP
jgi:hypothetical protein